MSKNSQHDPERSNVFTILREISPARRTTIDEQLEMAVREAMSRSAGSKVVLSFDFTPREDEQGVDVDITIDTKLPKIAGGQTRLLASPKGELSALGAARKSPDLRVVGDGK